MDMPVDVVVRDGQSNADSLREYARHRLSFAVRRFRHRIVRVAIRLVDLNGPRRGLDSRCSMTADLIDGRQIFVSATAVWPFAAISLGASRLGEALRRDASRHSSFSSASM